MMVHACQGTPITETQREALTCRGITALSFPADVTAEDAVERTMASMETRRRSEAGNLYEHDCG